MSVVIAERQERERAFHNDAFAGDVRRPAAKFYAVGQRARACYQASLTSRAAGRTVLEYGCGPGSLAFHLARHGAAVTGIDISEVAIAQAAARGQAEQVPRAQFRVMDAERLEFPENSFDLVCGRAIIHHLDIERACGELVRILRPEGEAVFWEPLGHNPLINLYRRATPRLRTADEHPLRMKDLRLLDRYFGRVECQFFTLYPLLAVPFRDTAAFGPLNTVLEWFDRCTFGAMPPLRRYAWQVVILASQPRKSTLERSEHRS